ncbi:LOW QUALITY PROTEIN: axonemal inner arm I1 intermediate chain dynein IC138, putative [Eimeria necatrix]|uniref:Dynein axonemal intermediate chain 4 n=1 Tax=Eimeria necatrix TaxID=51315 RepID=U6MV26_9EIME|nr:LOW QUALITY PROTEIN: axonemal inner arm I1 intermediate chain dynein IC138, putative [Eimeria necatrix]CDJ68037.1 axonemal inner arm I1 intermediate chain dynein IC138, putative [Eimeria necatrix]
MATHRPSLTASQPSSATGRGSVLSRRTSDFKQQNTTRRASISRETPIPKTSRATDSLEGPRAGGAEAGGELLVELEETETLLLFSKASSCAVMGSEEQQQIAARNKAYAELLAARAAVPRKFKTAHTQTLNPQQKLKAVATDSSALLSAAVAATPADIHDALTAKPRKPLTTSETLGKKQQKSLLLRVSPRDILISGLATLRSAGPPAAFRQRWGLLGGPSSSPHASLSRKSDFNASQAQQSLKARGRENTKRAAGSLLNKRSTGTGEGNRADTRQTDGSSSNFAPRRSQRQVLEETEESFLEESQEAASKEIDPKAGWKMAADGPLPAALAAAALRIEAALCQQQFHKQQMIYRSFRALQLAEDALEAQPTDMGSHTGIRTGFGEDAEEKQRDASDSDEAEDEQQSGGSRQQLKELLDFDGRALCDGHGVRALAYHPVHKDTLCAAYSSPAYDCSKRRTGKLLLWSIANPLHPQRVINCKTGVTTVEFGPSQPNLLAAATAAAAAAAAPARARRAAELEVLLGFCITARVACSPSALGERSSSSTSSSSSSSSSRSRRPCALLLSGGMVDGGVGVWDVRVPRDQPVLHSAGSEGVLGCQHSDTVWDLKWILKEGTEGLLTTGGDGQVLQWSMQKGLTHSVAMVVRRTANAQLLQVTARKKDMSRSRFFSYASGLSLDVAAHGDGSSLYFVSTDGGAIHKCSLAYNEQFLATYLSHKAPVRTVRLSPFSPNFLLSGSADWTVRLWPVARSEAEAEVFISTEAPSAVSDVCWYAPCAPVVVVGDDEGCISLVSIQEEAVPAYSRQEQQERLEQAFQARASQHQRGPAQEASAEAS